MLGAIIGDMAGSRFEFNPTNNYHFEAFSEASDFTDDTICTVAVADAILRGTDYGVSIYEWCRRYPCPTGGYGGRFAQWVRSNAPKPYGSFGNGAAMRVSPVAWAYDSREEVLFQAAKTAECTHNHPEGIKGAQTVALAIFTARTLREQRNGFGEREMKELMDVCVGFSHYDLHIRKEHVQNRFDETCQGTVPVALWIVQQSHGFEDAVRRAVSLGADADTLGAIVGSIAEAIWGIPEAWQGEALRRLPDEMKNVVLRFYKRVIKVHRQHVYDDERAARDLMFEEEQEEIKEKTKRQSEEDDELQQFKAIMHWKLGCGHMGKFFNGQNPMPEKSKIAQATSWDIKPLPPKDVSILKTNIEISEQQMEMVSRGHIPEAQEDHWFMYCDKEYIRYYRSWTGICAFEAHYTRKDKHTYVIDEVKINQALVEFGVNGDIPGLRLFFYLVVADSGANPSIAWNEYLDAWQKQLSKTKKLKL